MRDARPADAVEIGRVHIQVWREAYAGLMPADYLAALDPQASAVRWAEMLAQPADGVRRLVGVSPAGEVMAIAAAGPSRDDDAPTPWELWAINVLAAHHGTGIADLLMGHLVGTGPASLWVLRGNERGHEVLRAARLPAGRRGEVSRGDRHDRGPLGASHRSAWMTRMCLWTTAIRRRGPVGGRG